MNLSNNTEFQSEMDTQIIVGELNPSKVSSAQLTEYHLISNQRGYKLISFHVQNFK